MSNKKSSFNPFSWPAAETETSVQTTTTDDSESFVEVMDTDASPAASLDLEVTPRHSSIGVDSAATTTQICATIKACDLCEEDESARAPVDIVVALDVSGSMHGAKLDLCKKTLELLLRELRHHDRFGLVTFADEARIEIPARKLTEANKITSLDKIKNLCTRGCTNISGGIGMAVQEIRAVETPNDVKTIFLLTDGHANRGVVDAAGIVDLTAGCLEGTGDNSAPPTIHTFGYGSDHDASLLGAIAQASSGGTYCFVENDSNVAAAFGDALGGVLSVVAQNTVITIATPPEAAALGVTLVDVHHQKKIKRDDGSYRVEVGDFYAEEIRDVIFEVSLASGSELASMEGNAPVPHAVVSLAYMDTVNKKLVNGKACAALVGRPSGTDVATPQLRVAVQWLRIRATQAMAEAEALSRCGNFDGARAKIRGCMDEIRREGTEGAQSDPVVAQMMADLNDLLAGLSSKRDYDTFGAQYLQQQQQTHTMQRCTMSSATTAHVYRGSRKAGMSCKMNELSKK